MAYASVVVEGGLFPADLLDSIAAGAAEGQRAADFGAASGRLTDTIQSAFADARSHWDSWQRRRLASALPDARLTRQDWGLKLAELLGYGELHRHREAPEVDGRSYAIYAAAGAAPDAPPVHIVGSNQSLERRAGRRSPHALVQEYLNNGEALWGIVSNGLRLRLLRDSARFTRPTYLEFNLEGIIEGNQYAEFALLYRLLHRSRLPANGAPAHECLLERYYQQGLDQHGRVRERLRDGVESALIALGNGFLRHPDSGGLRRRLLPSDADADADAGNAGASSGNGANRHGGMAALSATDYYRQLLRLVYRLLFLMTAEERGMLAPAGGGDNTNANANDTAAGASGESGELYAIYHNYYSVTRLRGRAERPFGDNIGSSDRRRAADLWPGLQQTFRLFRADAPAALLGLKALDGELFGADGCPDLENAAIANYDLLRAMLNLSTFRDDGNVRRRVNYAGIDVEEFGSVYESLLDFHPQISRARGLEFGLAAGSERKQTGSYYTPPELVRQLVDSALEPVLAERLAAASAASSAAGGAGRGRRRGNGSGTGAGTDAQVAALLALKVCDPAAGSGHFLLAAARRIARRVAQLRSGEDEPAPLTYRTALRDTIRNCIYAVDRNPLAVDLCKVALWIEGHEPGLPLSFLDHRIKCGDSLVGLASWDALDGGIPNAAYKPIAGDDKAAAAEYGKRNRAELKGRVQLRLGDDASGVAGIARQSIDLADMDENTAGQVQEKAAQYETMRAPDPQSDWWTRKVASDLWTSAFFIPKQPAAELQPYGVPTTGTLRQHLETNSAYPELVGKAVAVSERSGFLHWPLDFPEVFSPGGPGGFDVVLGNPPWGQKQTSVDPSTVKFIRSEYQSVAGIFDWFRPFLERGLSLLREGGRFGVVLPDTVLLKDYEATRRLLLEAAAIGSITWWGAVFASATIDAVTISGVRAAPSPDHMVDVAVHDPLNPLAHCIPQSDFGANPRLTFNLHLTPEKRATLKSLNRYPVLGEFFEVHEGVHSGNMRAKLFVPEKKDDSCQPLIVRGKEISPYALGWGGAYIRLDAVPIRKTPESYANIGKLAWYNQDKLLIQRTGDRVIAAVDREKRFASNNFFIAFPKRHCALEIDGLCALLNSELITWFFRAIEPREGRAFAELKIKHLEQFPLPLLENGNPIDGSGIRRLNCLGGERARLASSGQAVRPRRIEILDKEIDLLLREFFAIATSPSGELIPIPTAQEVRYDNRKSAAPLFDC